MELRHLRYFSAVARTLNFREAAEHLHVSRPALSMQIRDLEEEMGVRLLERSTTRVSLTAAGVAFLEDVEDILARVERATRRARETATGAAGHITIGEMGPLTPSFLPAAVRRFRQRFPAIEIAIVEVDKHEQVRALREGRLDVGFVLDVDLHLPAGFCSRPLMSSSIGLAVARDHPLAARSSVELEELVDEQFIVNSHARAKGHEAHTREAFESNGLAVPRIVATQSFEALMARIVTQQGVSFLPETLAESRLWDVTFLPIPRGLLVPRVTLHAVWAGEAAPPLAASFIEAFDGIDARPRVVGE